MIRNWWMALLVLCAAAVASPAMAQNRSYTFAPVQPGYGITGSFTLDFDGAGYNLVSFNGLSSNGYVFDLSNTGRTTGGGAITIGGLINGVNVVASGTDDFFFNFNPVETQVVVSMAYAQAQGGGGPVDTAITQAPEPGAWTLMILGFGVVGATMRRRPAPAVGHRATA